jgi:hypothetical protein
MKRIASLLVLMAGLAGACFGQTSLTQTTLASAVSGPSLYSGTSQSLSLTVTLASCTGLAAPVLPGTPSSIIYVGREALGVFNINTTTCVANVNRGYLGTNAAPHPSGDMVLYGPNYAVTVAFGGNPVPNGLFQQDPSANGTCTAANTPATPWLNVLTGAQWLCSSITGTWVPGFNNPLAQVSPGQTATVALVASAANTPTGPFFIATGTTVAFTGFTTPIGCNATAVGACEFTIFSATANSAVTWTAAGNISTAGTLTAGKAFTFTWSPSLSKWVPSALA